MNVLERYFLKDLATQLSLAMSDIQPLELHREQVRFSERSSNTYEIEQPMELPASLEQLRDILREMLRPTDVILIIVKAKQLAILVNFDYSLIIEDRVTFYDNIPEQFPKGYIYQSYILNNISWQGEFIVFNSKRQTLIALQQLIANLTRQSIYSDIDDNVYNISWINNPKGGIIYVVILDDIPSFIDSVLKMELMMLNFTINPYNKTTGRSMLLNLPPCWRSVTIPNLN